MKKCSVTIEFLLLLSCSLCLGIAHDAVASDNTPCAFVGQPTNFSDDFDVDSTGAADDGQILQFDCFGGASHDPSLDADLGNTGLQVDAVANRQDQWYPELVANEVQLILSVEADRNIYYERPSGATGLWLPNVARVDVDALEVYGDSKPDWYSSQGDLGGVSLQYQPFSGIPLVGPAFGPITQTEILAGIQSLGVGLGLTVDDIDVDAAMRKYIDNESLIRGKVLFSVAPVQDLDGGEIFELDLDAGSAVYLDHGGHLWNTAFDVRAAFDVQDENINAIEAVHFIVPEPNSLALLGLGGLMLARRRHTR